MTFVHAVDFFLYVILIQQRGWRSESYETCIFLVITVERYDFSALFRRHEGAFKNITSHWRISCHQIDYVVNISKAHVKSELSCLVCQDQE